MLAVASPSVRVCIVRLDQLATYRGNSTNSQQETPEMGTGSDMQRKEQFRATRLWNTIVSVVREELPVKRHRRGLKHFENCFTGDEAVSWTLRYLEQNRGALLGPEAGMDYPKVGYHQPGITREKVTLLLQKFVEQKIIEDVRGRGEPFRDSSKELYIFNKENVAPLRTFPPTMSSSREDCRSHAGSLNHILPPQIKSATSFVKVAFVGLSMQKERRETSSSVRT